MILTFPADVLDRLEEIERDEGCPPEETIRTAVGVWTLMNADDRRQTTLLTMRNALRRLNENGDGGRQ